MKILIQLISLVGIISALVQCSENKTTKLASRPGSGSQLTANQVESEIAKSGSLLLEGIQAELLATGQPAALSDLVVQEAKKELSFIDPVNYKQNLNLATQKSGYQLDGGSPVQAASFAVTYGALNGFKKYQTQQTSLSLNGIHPQNSGSVGGAKKFGLTPSTQEVQFLNLVSRGQIRGLAQLKDKGLLIDSSPSNLAQTILVIASAVIEQSAKLGMVNEQNVEALSAELTSALTSNLSQTSLKDAAPEAISLVSKALGGLKSLALPVTVLSKVASGTIETAEKSILSNGLVDKSSSIILQSLNSSISASYVSASSTQDFAVITGSLAGSAFGSYTDLNPSTNTSDTRAAAELIFGTAISSLSNLSNIDASTISTVLAEVQKNAHDSVNSSGLAPASATSIIESVNATVLHLAQVVGLPAVESIPGNSSSLADQLNAVQNSPEPPATDTGLSTTSTINAGGTDSMSSVSSGSGAAPNAGSENDQNQVVSTANTSVNQVSSSQVAVDPSTTTQSSATNMAVDSQVNSGVLNQSSTVANSSAESTTTADQSVTTQSTSTQSTSTQSTSTQSTSTQSTTSTVASNMDNTTATVVASSAPTPTPTPTIQERYYSLCVNGFSISSPNPESCLRFNDCFNIGYPYSVYFDKYSQCKFYKHCIYPTANYLESVSYETLAAFCSP